MLTSACSNASNSRAHGRWHADAGVEDVEAQPHRPAGIGLHHADTYLDPAMVGELDRVAGQVQQDLPQVPDIARTRGGTPSATFTR